MVRPPNVYSSLTHSQSSLDDVLKARLKTVGVSEHRFEMEAGTESGTEWRIIDVGGSRSQVSFASFHLPCSTGAYHTFFRIAT